MSRYLDIQEFVENSVTESPALNFIFCWTTAGYLGSIDSYRRRQQPGRAFSRVAPILVVAATDGAVQLPFRLSKWISENGTYSSSVMMLSTPLEIAQLSERLATRLNAAYLQAWTRC
jgi:hypothetical protein